MLTSINDESTDKSPYTRPQRIEHIEWIKVKFEKDVTLTYFWINIISGLQDALSKLMNFL